MEIRKGRKEDLNRILELYTDARKYMAENGNPNQWKDSWPPEDMIVDDIEKGKNYVCTDEDEIVGTFFMDEGPDHTYDKIYEGEWTDTQKQYVVIHRITTDRNKHGVGKFIMNFAYEQLGNVKIDTHRDNKPMQGLVTSCGFKYCGIIYIDNGEERLAYQKIWNTDK